MKRISLHGSYFGNNYGDILLMNLFSKWTRECFQDCIINMPLATRCHAKDLDYDTTGVFNLIRSNALIFCGGGYFGEQPIAPQKWARRNFFRHGIVGLLALLFDVPYAIIGVEFGPISTPWFRKFCIFLAKHAKVVVVRNIESKEFLQIHGVSNSLLSSDAVLSLSEVVVPIVNDSKLKKVLIHFSGLKEDSEYIFSILTKIVHSANEYLREYSLVFISDGPNNNYSGSQYEKVFAFFKDNSVLYCIEEYSSSKALIELINNGDFIITSKLHVGITAASLDKKVLSLWSHPKSRRLHYQIGNSNFCVKLTDVNDFDFDQTLMNFFTRDSYNLPASVKQSALFNREKLWEFLKQYSQ